MLGLSTSVGSYDTVCITVIHLNQRVQKEHNGKKTMLIIATPKTPSSIRTIPIPNQLLQIIKSSELPQKGYLLTGSTEKYIEPRTYQYHFKKLLQRCKIPETNFHALRHTFATRCVTRIRYQNTQRNSRSFQHQYHLESICTSIL